MKIEANNVAVFDSMADLKNWMRPERCLLTKEMPEEWYGNATKEQAIAMLSTGDMSQVCRAEDLMQHLNLDIKTTGQQMSTGAAGFMPSVPDYLGGSPECMYYMEDYQTTLAPLKVLYNPTSSVGFTPRQLSERGVIALAMVMALAVIRPVTLEIVTTLDAGPEFSSRGKSFSAIRVAINSSPLDLASACYAMCHSGMTRRILYGAHQWLFKSPLTWSQLPGVNMYDSRNPDTQAATLRELGESEQTALLIPCICQSDPMMANPTKWIQGVLDKYSTAN